MGQLVSGYLDFAEREQAMTMKDWAEHFDRILTIVGNSFCRETEVLRINRLLIKQQMNIKSIRHGHLVVRKKIT